MEDVFQTYETKPKLNANDHTETKPNVTQFVNISDLFKKDEYKKKLESMRELVKVADILDRPLIILGYREDTMTDIHNGGEKACFRMDFKFADDPDDTAHYIRTEATYLWDYLKTVHQLNPDILTSGNLCAMIAKGEKKNGKNRTPFYYFVGTMDA